MNDVVLGRMKTVFFIFTVVVVLFSFSSVAFATTVPDSSDSNIFVNVFNWCRGLIVPTENFFPNEIMRLSDLLNSKLGGVGDLFKIIRNFWSSLGTSSRSISFSVPNNFFFAGYRGISVDPFSQASVYIGYFRDVFGVFISIVTAIFCYRTVMSFFR